MFGCQSVTMYDTANSAAHVQSHAVEHYSCYCSTYFGVEMLLIEFRLFHKFLCFLAIEIYSDTLK